MTCSASRRNGRGNPGTIEIHDYHDTINLEVHNIYEIITSKIHFPLNPLACLLRLPID